MDKHGRRISYLRLSVTDLCNLRCQYCMPAEGVSKLHHREILSFEDQLRIARAAVSLGITKIRVTGGEPLVRPGVTSFLERVGAIDGLKELALTTNGVLLRQMAFDLRRAGVDRLNVSLDSLNPATFALLTRGGALDKTLDGIAAACEAGFPPVKINVVVIRGINDSELLDFAALTLHRPHQIRFIEYMPTNNAFDGPAALVRGEEILERIARVYPLRPVPVSKTSGPAQVYRIPLAKGTLGVITPVSNHFCATCNRIRVTAQGEMKSCLFDGGGISLKPYLERGDEALREAMMGILRNKPEGHRLHDETQLLPLFSMSQVGG
jgi:cyclic pyranopterin phosphate synthase